MGFSVTVQYETSVDELITRFPCFSKIKSLRIPHTKRRRWNRGSQTSYDAQVIFVGKTGYGKSTTVNALVGRDLFASNDVEACTRICQSVEFRLAGIGSPYYFSLGDLPGIGESAYCDGKYIEMYRSFLAKTDVAIYLLRADNRDFSIDLNLFSQLFCTEVAKSRVVIALNGADKIEPLSRRYPFAPTSQHLSAIRQKVNHVSSTFGIPEDRIIPYSATESWNLDALAFGISERLYASPLQ